MTINDLRLRHQGKPIFVLGTAPHLDELDLSRLRGQVAIGCNQLALQADALGLSYVCMLAGDRFAALRDQLEGTQQPAYVVSEQALAQQAGWQPSDALRQRLVPLHTRFTSPGHAEFFSFDLPHCAYAGNVVAMAIQLAVWMGGNPIYILGVDDAYTPGAQPYYRASAPLTVDVTQANRYSGPDFREWLRKVQTLLWARGIRLINAAGTHSTLSVLPRMRLAAATGDPLVAVTSKTFCQDEYLVGELKRFFPRVRLNDVKNKLEGEGLTEFLSDADAMILGTEPLTGAVMEQLPCLRYVAKYGVGLDNVDFEAAKRLRIEVSYKKGVNNDSVAELTLAFALMLLRRMDDSIAAYRGGKWAKLPGRELAEITVGIIGYGHVGKVVAQKFAALGVGRLLVNDLLDFPTAPPAEFVPLPYLLAESDLVSLHVSLDERSRQMVNPAFLAALKPGALLINTARGELVNEAALAAALHSGHLAGAALDVYADEPRTNPVLLAAPHLLTTCHIAGSSNRAIKNMGWAAIEGLHRLISRQAL